MSVSYFDFDCSKYLELVSLLDIKVDLFIPTNVSNM